MFKRYVGCKPEPVQQVGDNGVDTFSPLQLIFHFDTTTNLFTVCFTDRVLSTSRLVINGRRKDFRGTSTMYIVVPQQFINPRLTFSTGS